MSTGLSLVVRSQVMKTMNIWLDKGYVSSEVLKTAVQTIEKRLAEARRLEHEKSQPGGWHLVPVGDQTIDVTRLFLWNQYGSFGDATLHSLGDPKQASSQV